MSITNLHIDTPCTHTYTHGTVSFSTLFSVAAAVVVVVNSIRERSRQHITRPPLPNRHSHKHTLTEGETINQNIHNKFPTPSTVHWSHSYRSYSFIRAIDMYVDVKLNIKISIVAKRQQILTDNNNNNGSTCTTLTG